MCDRSTEGGEPQLQECAEYLGDASLRLLRAMIHSRDLVGWGILASDDVRSARDRFSGCSRQIDPLHQGLAALLALGIAVGQEIGRASCRERECQNVWISVVAVSLKKK